MGHLRIHGLGLEFPDQSHGTGAGCTWDATDPLFLAGPLSTRLLQGEEFGSLHIPPRCWPGQPGQTHSSKAASSQEASPTLPPRHVVGGSVLGGQAGSFTLRREFLLEIVTAAQNPTLVNLEGRESQLCKRFKCPFLSLLLHLPTVSQAHTEGKTTH